MSWWLTLILLCATLQVNVDSSPLVAKAENVRIVPTFKIYKDGVKVKEMICPTLHVLRYTVRHYSVSSSWEALGTGTPISRFHWCIELPFSPSNLQHYQPPEHSHHLHNYSHWAWAQWAKIVEWKSPPNSPIFFHFRLFIVHPFICQPHSIQYFFFMFRAPFTSCILIPILIYLYHRLIVYSPASTLLLKNGKCL